MPDSMTATSSEETFFNRFAEILDHGAVAEDRLRSPAIGAIRLDGRDVLERVRGEKSVHHVERRGEGIGAEGHPRNAHQREHDQLRDERRRTPGDAPTERALDEISPAVLRDALFGISLEPAGGSPTGRPTGPALHGTLIPTAPPDGD